MKEIDFKKQAEVEETLAHAHIETDTDVATETIMTKGHVDCKWVIIIFPVHFLCLCGWTSAVLV
jgi:hypothetical protein